MSLSVFSRFSACRSSLVKLLSGREADCMTSLATSLPVAQWLERPTGVREVMGSGTQNFSLSLAGENRIFHLSQKKFS